MIIYLYSFPFINFITIQAKAEQHDLVLKTPNVGLGRLFQDKIQVALLG